LNIAVFLSKFKTFRIAYPLTNKNRRLIVHDDSPVKCACAVGGAANALVHVFQLPGLDYLSPSSDRGSFRLPRR
jgi:hypothetical protein